MNKAELIATIAEKTDMTKSEIETVFATTFETITEVLVKQEKVMIPGFGSFSTKVREERKGRNPATGKEMMIPKTIVSNFKAATQLKETINSN